MKAGTKLTVQLRFMSCWANTLDICRRYTDYHFRLEHLYTGILGGVYGEIHKKSRKIGLFPKLPRRHTPQIDVIFLNLQQQARLAGTAPHMRRKPAISLWGKKLASFPLSEPFSCA